MVTNNKNPNFISQLGPQFEFRNLWFHQEF